ncbi:hypothetical protein KY345_06365 [Candidatus Woesearchaeota archaeon]|nr:hypothetical protein [Candidatus Woesearchaeota archaeon]
MVKYEFKEEGPSIDLVEGQDGVARSLSVRWLADELCYGRIGALNWVKIGKYTEYPLDARLAYLSDAQKERLSGDTNIPIEEINEIADIEFKNQDTLCRIILENNRRHNVEAHVEAHRRILRNRFF